MTLSADSVLFVGDTHGNSQWLSQRVLPRAAELEVDAILQVGDFGYWSDSQSFLKAARTARERYGVDVWFIDGNHEDHPLLRRESTKVDSVWDEYRMPVELSPGFFYLPRGSRVEISGLSVACCGGAVSIDRKQRVAGKSWFMEERVNDTDIEAIARNGKADILVTHDAPAGWEIPGLMNRADLPISWQGELTACDEGRERLAEVINIVQPKVLVHGHYHVGYSKTVDLPFGQVDVNGLNCEFTQRWGMVLRPRDPFWYLEWENDIH